VNSLKAILMSSIAATAFVAAACGGSSNPPNPPAISVTLSPAPPTSITAGTTASLTAIVSNDSSNAGVTWSVTCGGSPCGSFSPTSTASGAATTYTAPANVPTGGTVNVVATSVTDGTATASASITITAPAGVSVSFAVAPPAALTINNTFPLTAVVTNDSKNGGVTWSVTCGTAACGTFNPTTTASNVATTYTAPAAIPTGGTVKVIATSASDTTKSVSADISIVGPALADGTYIYNGSGIDGNGALYYAGAITVLNGTITGGEHDWIDESGSAATDTIAAAGSSLTTQPEGNVEIIINTNDQNFGDSGTFVLRGTNVTATRMQLTEFDDFATATGSLFQQTGKAAPAGGYAFEMLGFDDVQPNNNPLGIGGVLNFAGTALNTAGSVFDYNDGGNPIGQNQTFTNGTITAPDAMGRVVINLTPSGTFTAFGMVGYIIGPNRIALIEFANDNLGGTMGGVALGQGVNTGSFTAGNVQNSVYVFSALGDDSSVLTMAGGFALNPGGNIQGNISVSDLNTNGSTDVTGNWTVDQTGRVTVSNITPLLVNNVPIALQLYLDGNGNALELGVDSSEVTAGSAFAQTSTSGNINAGNYAIGGFGFFPDSTNPNLLDAWSAVGPVAITGNSLNGFTDYNAFGTLTDNVTLTGSIDSSTGLIAINGLDVNNTSPDSYGYYPIDDDRTVAIELDGNQLGIVFLEMVTP
jgi:hypothetical protein